MDVAGFEVALRAGPQGPLEGEDPDRQALPADADLQVRDRPRRLQSDLDRAARDHREGHPAGGQARPLATSRRRGSTVVDRDGKQIDPSSIDWSKQSAATFPYMLRQGPGPDNALGRVKLIFPNPYFVYLHDTPHKELFEKDERAFSSGCIRVERPLELAGVAPERSPEVERRRDRGSDRGRRDPDRPAAEAGAGSADVLDDRPREPRARRLQARPYDRDPRLARAWTPGSFPDSAPRPDEFRQSHPRASA